jgi:hypothetical protein
LTALTALVNWREPARLNATAHAIHVGPIGSSHAMMLAMFFGLIALDESATPGPPPPGDANAQQWAPSCKAWRSPLSISST